MNNNMEEALKFYCQSELNDLINSNVYASLKQQVEFTDFSIECSMGKESDILNSNDMCISVSILDEEKKIVGIYDEGFLTAVVKLVTQDKKGRTIFTSWNNEQFIEDINWIKWKLKNLYF